uniref:HPS5-like beta-propeller domain-containing protein n=1 Tax=Plectus sambesii TaxID=2011161 RepID=A0A914XKC2_9BILA
MLLKRLVEWYIKSSLFIEGAAVKVLVATNEKHLAVATNRGHISIASLTGGAPTTVLNNTLHKGAIVTSLIWAEDGTKLLAGDSKGLVSCSRVASRNLFRTACEPVLEADSGVVQLDVNGDAVLISTATRSQLFHLGRSTCIQVGKKLRHEPCGAIFARPGAIERPLIFAGRPNGRLWECDCEGAVYSTHQFSNVTDVPLPPVATHRHDFDPDSGPSLEAIRFGRVHVIYLQEHMFILTVNDSRLCVVEPQKGRVVLVCDVGHSAREYAVCGSDVFLLCESNGSLRKLSLFPLDKAVDKLHWRECYRQAAQVMLAYGPSLPPPSPWKTETVVDVLNHVKDDDAFTSVMIDQLTALLHTAKRRDANAKTSTVMRLSTGKVYLDLLIVDLHRLSL